MKKLLSTLCLVLVAALYTTAHADETAGEKIENSADTAAKDAKRAGRKAKKAIRDNTGNSSITEDAKDSVNNTADSMEVGAKKAKRKMD